MDYSRFFWSGFLATVIMTVFSYVTSYALNVNFKEPLLLGILIQRVIKGNNFISYPSGWIIHYAVGYLFVLAYILLWENTSVRPKMLNGVWLGAVSGIVGVGIWHLTLKLHPDPPYIKLGSYYLHLVIAHIIFGLGAVVGYGLSTQ